MMLIQLDIDWMSKTCSIRPKVEYSNLLLGGGGPQKTNQYILATEGTANRPVGREAFS